MEIVTVNTGTNREARWRVHDASKCKGQRCVFHNPSEHRMSSWRMILRETGLVERACMHGVGHPDPDSVDYFNRMGWKGYDVHGCDGCCGTLGK